jgi:integrase
LKAGVPRQICLIRAVDIDGQDALPLPHRVGAGAGPTEVRGLAQAVDQEVARKWRSRETEMPPYGLLVEFAAFTGLRAGEIAALRTANLDLRAATLFVARSSSLVRGRWVEGEPKTKAGRRSVFINQALCDRLREHLGDRCSTGRGTSSPDETTVHSTTARSTARTSAPPCWQRSQLTSTGSVSMTCGTPTPASWWNRAPVRSRFMRYRDLTVEQGAHPKEMAELMGHASVQITLDRYGHVMPRLTLALAERLDAAYRAAEPASLLAVRAVANPVATLRPR